MTDKKNILVIDDEMAVRRSFELSLEDSGYNVVTVDSGEKGVLEFQKNPYQLVFLDLKMPEMTGVETLKKLRGFSLTVPIYIVTAFHKEFLNELDSVRKLGLEFQLVCKPIGCPEIQALAQSVLEQPICFESFQKKNPEEKKYQLKLYLAGITPKTEEIVNRFKQYCATRLENPYELEVIDVLATPELAKQEKILATPMASKETPEKILRVLLDFANEEKMLLGVCLLLEK